MLLTKRIICLANSAKNGGICIAGRELLDDKYGEWVRPVSSRPTAELKPSELCYDSLRLPQLLDVIDVPLLRPLPHGHQAENYLIDSTRRWSLVRRAAPGELEEVAETPASLWNDSSSTHSGNLNCVGVEEALLHGSSLYLIQVRELQVKVEADDLPVRPDFFGTFPWGRRRYTMKITDPAFFERLKSCPDGLHDFAKGGKAYLCISLTEPWKDRRCHKLIAAVMTDSAL